jgi:hypothetical protein
MTGDKFHLFTEHFLNHILVTKGISILLLLDSHQSRVSRTVFDLPKENGAVLLSFQYNSTHKLKRLYRSIY